MLCLGKQKSCTAEEKEKSKQKRDNAVQSFDQNFINQFYTLLNKESEKIFDQRAVDFRDTRINFFKRVMSELPQGYQNSSSPRFQKAITTHLFLLYLIGLRDHEFRECSNSPLIINTSYPIVVYCVRFPAQ